MKMSDLYEAPIVDLAVTGSEEPGAFDEKDTKAIFNPKWIKNVRTLYKNSSYNINVLIYNDPDIINRRPTFKDGVVAFDSKIIKPIMDSHSLTDPHNSINVLLLQNEGVDKIPLTPWMVGHRLVHAMAFANDAGMDNSRGLTLGQYIQQYYFDMIVRLLNIYYIGIDSTNPRFGEYSITDVVNKTFTYGSARNKKITRTGEAVVDSLVQYLVKNKITVNEFQPFDNTTIINKKYVDHIVGELNSSAKKIFDNCVGLGVFVL